MGVACRVCASASVECVRSASSSPSRSRGSCCGTRRTSTPSTLGTAATPTTASATSTRGCRAQKRSP
eukprot:6213520-Alexandrium_andersonii.AAC.1